MRRREFVKFIGAGTITWPFSAAAQPTSVPVVGFLSGLSPEGRVASYTAAFLKGMGETGYAAGRNVTIEYRWARDRYDLLPSMAADLVQRKVNVIAAIAGPNPGLAAKAATSTIPIVFQTGSDPIKDGLVTSINHPGGNITGVTRLATTVEPKRMQLLHELVPSAATITVMVNPDNPAAETQLREMQAAAHSLNLQLDVKQVRNQQDLEATFAGLAHQGMTAVLIATDPFLGSHEVIALAAHYAIPVCYFDRTHVLAGGLIAYGASLPDSWRQAGVYTGRVLKGEKPADLPVLQPTKYELTINLKTAKALGIEVPSGLLAIADEVIE